MLKKNLVRTSLFSQGLLLLVPGITALKGESVFLFKQKHSVYRNVKDTLQVPFSSDSSGYLITPLTQEDLALMPKIGLNKSVCKFVKSFLVKEDEALQKAKARSASYFKTINDIFTQYGLPVELKYLAVVESYLKTNAVSKAGAKGMWQLMPVTARELGLKITSHYDERTHFYKSTVAAAKYLKALHSEFGDWLLAIAAYNSGPGAIYAAIKKAGSKNFWALQNYLPAESRGHVKRYIGTHYYFEGKGGVTTLTKAETIKYNKEVENFKMTMRSKQEQPADSTEITAVNLR